MKKTIHYALILDQSGSMHHLQHEVISSFNEQVEMIRKLNKTEPELGIKVTLCVFNDTVEFKYKFENIDRLKKLTVRDYNPNSTTALYDAMGVSFLKLNEGINPADKVFFAIFTDGLENASTDYSTTDIRLKIKKAEKDGWQIQFFCRDEDEAYYKTTLGLSDDMKFCLNDDSSGMKVMEEQIMFRIQEIVNSGKEDNQQT